MTRPELIHSEISEAIIGAFFEVHKTLGNGFLENLYASALERELRDRGRRVARQVTVRIYYKEHELGTQRLDMIVDEVVVVELKTASKLPPESPKQLFSYLHATNLELGLLLFFGPKPSFFRLIASNNRKRSLPRHFQGQPPSEPMPHRPEKRSL